MTPRNLKLVLAYDGAAFHGWQTQPGQRTVQDETQQTIMRIVRHPVVLIGASRTDAGVHAAGQSANFRTECSIPIEGLRRAISHHLPQDVALVSIRAVPMDFHSTRGARGKLYRYRLHAAEQRPVLTQALHHAWHVWHPLDPQRMQAAGARMSGTHDFAGFASAGSPRPTTVRTVRRVNVLTRLSEVRIDVEGDGFLYNQVRNMVGTLVEIGRGHWPVERVREILEKRDRALAGPTAPPHGLCLQWVRYDAIAAPNDESEPQAPARGC